MSTTIDNQIVNLQFNNKDFEKNAAQSLKTVDKLKKSLDFSGVKSGFETIANSLKKVTSTVSGAVTGVEKFYNVYKKLGDVALHPVRNLKELGANAEAVSQSFSKLEEISVGALRRLGEQALDAGERLAKSLTIDQLSAGWEKFGEKTRSVASIMSATGMSADEVTEKLKKLNWYTDETSYAYTDMTNNIGKFTNAGIALDDAITAMIGIGNAAGLAGSSVQDASHAMEGFSGAIAQGYMDRQRWSWIKTAHMDTVQFKEALIDAAVAEGVLEKGAEGVYGAFGSFDDDSIVTIENFENAMTKAKWLTTNVMTRALKRFGGTTEELYEFMQAHDEIEYTSDAIKALGVSEDDLGLKAFKASQEARTLSDAIDSVKDAVSTGFMTAFEHFIGNYEQAKELWTDLANTLWDVFSAPIDNLNSALDDWSPKGFDRFRKSLYQIMDTVAAFTEAIKQGWTDVFGEMNSTKIQEILNPFHNFTDRLEASATNGILGKLADIWYNFLRIVKAVGDAFSSYHEAFTNAFTNSGLYDAIYSVKDAFGAVEETIDEVSEAAQEASEYVEKAFQAVSDIWTKGSFGNGEARVRALEALGLDPKYVQKHVNQIAYGSKKSLDEVHEQMVKDGYTVGESVSEGLEEVEEEESGIVRMSSKLGKVLGGVADAIREVFFDDSVYHTIYDIFLGFWSLVEMIRSAIDQFGQSMKKNSGLKNIVHWILDPIANVARTITDTVANGGLLKVRAIVSQLVTLFNTFTGVIRDFGKAGSDAFHNVFGDIDILDIVRNALSGLIDGINSVRQALNENDRITRIFSGIAAMLRIVTKLVSKLFGKTLKVATKNVLPTFLDILAAIGDVLTSFADDDIAVEAFIYGLTQAFEKAKEIIGGIIDVGKVVIGVISKAVTWVVNLANTVKDYITNSKVFQNVSTVLSNLSTAISNLFGKDNAKAPDRAMSSLVNEGKKGEGSFSWLNVLLGVVELLATGFNNLVTGIANVISWVDAFIDKIQNGSGDTRSGNKDIFSQMSTSLSGVLGNTDSEEVTRGSAKFFGNVLTGIGEAVTNFFKNTEIDWEKLKTITSLFAIIWGLVEFRKGTKNLSDALDKLAKVPLSIADIFSNFNDVVANVKGTVAQAKTSLQQITQAQVIESYVYALVAVAGAVILLGKLPENELSQGIAAMVILGTFFAIFAKIVSKMNTSLTSINRTKISNSGNKTLTLLSNNTANIDAGTLGVAAMILAIAGFALAIASALSQVNTMIKDIDLSTTEGMQRLVIAVGIVVILMGLLGVLVYTFAEAAKKLDSKSITKFLGFATKSEGPSGVFTSLAVAILAIGGAIEIIVNAMTKLAKIPRTKLLDAFTAVSTIVIILGGIMAGIMYLTEYMATHTNAKKLSKAIEALLAMSVVITSLALAVDLLIPAIIVVAALTKDDVDGRMMQGIITVIGGLLVVLAGIASLLALLSSKTSINQNGILKPMLAMAAVMLIFATTLNHLLPVISALAVIEQFNNDPLASIKIAGAIAMMVVAFGAAIAICLKAMEKIKGSQVFAMSSVIVSIGAFMAIVAAVFSGVLKTLKQNNSTVGEFVAVAATMAIALVALMAAFMGMLTWLGALNEVETGDIKAMSVAILALCGGLMIIAGAFALLAKTVSVEDLQGYAAVFGMFILVMGGLAAVLAYVAPQAGAILQALGYILLGIAGILFGVSVAILVFGVALDVLGKAIPALVDGLPALGDSLHQFCEKIKDDGGTLLIAALAFGAFVVLVGAAIFGVIAIIATAFKSLNDSGGLPAIGKKTMMTVAAIVLGICAALSQTSPEVLKTIESIVVMVSAYLGEITGTLVESLLIFVLNLLEKLADAIDANTNYIWYVIVRILMSIGNLIMPALAGLFGAIGTFIYNSLVDLGGDIWELWILGSHMWEKILHGAEHYATMLGLYFSKGLAAAAGDIGAIAAADKMLDEERTAWEKIKTADEEAEANALEIKNGWKDYAKMDHTVGIEWWTEFRKNNFDDAAKNELRDMLGIDPVDYEKQQQDAAKALSDQSEKFAKVAGDNVAGSIKVGLENSKLKDLDLVDTIKDVTGWSDGEIDLSAVDWNVIADKLPIDQVVGDLSNMVDMGEISSTDMQTIMDNMTNEYGIDLGNMDITTDAHLGNIQGLWGDTTSAVTDNVDGCSDSMQQLIEAANGNAAELDKNMENTVTAVKSYKKPFYQAGFTLVHELKRGMEVEFGVTKDWLVSEMANIIDTAYNEWKVNSPSKLFFALGQFAMEGLAIGLQNDMPLKVMQQSINEISDAVTFGQFSEITPQIRPVIDMSNMRQTANEVDTLFKTPTVSKKLAASASQYVNTAFEYERNDKYNDKNVVQSISDLRTDIRSLNDNMMNTNIYLDSGALVGATVAQYDNALGQRAQRQRRGGR